MKKYRFIMGMTLMGAAILTGCSDRTQKMDIIHSYSMAADNWRSESISVIVDKSIAEDREKCSQEIIQRVLENRFPSTDFTFEENGYPNELSVSVYTSEKNFKDGNSTYHFDYVTDFNTEDIEIQNNIKDNPNAFRIEYRDK